jgi:hypothetical protein
MLFSKACVSLWNVKLLESFICITISVKMGTRTKKRVLSTTSCSTSSSQTPKSSQETLIAVIVIIAVAAVAVLIYVVMQGGGSGGGGGGGGGGGTTVSIAEATSLRFSVSYPSNQEEPWRFTFFAKNAGAPNIMLRAEMTKPTGTKEIYIFNLAQTKAWIYMDGQLREYQEYKSWKDIWASWQEQYETYKYNLAYWTGAGDYTYTASNGTNIRIYDISVNPSLEDSLFQK